VRLACRLAGLSACVPLILHVAARLVSQSGLTLDYTFLGDHFRAARQNSDDIGLLGAHP
jgi:hypothetical protein